MPGGLFAEPNAPNDEVVAYPPVEFVRRPVLGGAYPKVLLLYPALANPPALKVVWFATVPAAELLVKG